VDDLAAGFVCACGNEKTYNNHFQVLNDEVVVWEDLYRKVGELVGREPNLVYVPSILLRTVDEKLMGHLYYEKAYFSVFSTEKFRKAAPDWKPKYTYKEGIAKVIESWEAEHLAFDEQKDQLEDKICALYADFAQNLARLNTGVQFAHAIK
jgi:nucleoside-diphosphate-sugar epimerase